MIALKTPVKILLVDDQPAKLLSYETVLASLNETLVRANSGREALEYLLRNDVAVVLVDVCMPELDGFELATMIRSHPRFQKTAVILVSGVLVEDVDRLRGYDSGAVDYVSVPIVPEILRAKVAVFADLYRKTVELERLNQELERRVAERTAEIEASNTRLRQSEERLRLVLNAAAIQGWTWDLRRGQISWVRPPGSDQPMLQTFAEFLDCIHAKDRDAVAAAFQHALENGGEYQAEFRSQGATNGSCEEPGEEWWMGRGTLITDDAGQPLSIAGINLNITARKRGEQERARLLEETEEARREAERSNRLKDEFLATLSHELRTPLNAITGWSHLLLTADLDPGETRTAIETIHRNALLQAQLISELLDVARIVSGKLRLDLARVDLPGLVQTSLNAMRPAADGKNIRLEAKLEDAVGPLIGDPARLQQVISNLLSNAIKFTPANGLVEVIVRTRDSEIELTVRDDGSGIDDEFLPHIFDRFRQGDSSSTRAHQGLGLGLTIVRHIVEMHGGRVSAGNRGDRRGAAFTALLPMARAEAAAAVLPAAAMAAIPLPATTPLKGNRILVVDDEADARELAAHILERSGAEVLVAASAGEAFAILERELPDVLVADIEMPTEDGYSLVHRVRTLPADRGGQTAAIALTAYAGAQDQLKLLRAGFQRHVAKPVHPPDLVAAVATVASRQASATKAS